jgi:hypothetical protein
MVLSARKQVVKLRWLTLQVCFYVCTLNFRFPFIHYCALFLFQLHTFIFSVSQNAQGK